MNTASILRDALRRAFTETPAPDPEQDTPELAALVREGRRSRHVLHKKGDIRKVLARVRSRLGQ
jgi:hypothetical protein